MASPPARSLSSADDSSPAPGEPANAPVLPPLSIHASDDLLGSYNEQLGLSQQISQPSNEATAAQAPSSADCNSPTAQIVENALGKLLPLPTAVSGGHGNPSQTSFLLSEPGGSAVAVAGESEGPFSDVAKADVWIAPDGSFVQTSSALAARELKKSYDKILGVGPSVQGVVRSPYAITAMADGLGGTVFRVGHRALVEEGAAEAGNPQTQGTGRRRARLSVQDFLPTSMFKNSTDHGLSRQSINTFSGNSHGNNAISSTPLNRRKLRKSRSNTDLRITASPPNLGADYSGHLSPPPRSETFSIEIRDEITAGADAFGQVLGWSSELASDTLPSSRKAAKPSVPPTPEESPEHQETFNSPFSDNIRYTTPMSRSSIRLESPIPQLREMQSFESGLTAKIDDGPPKSPGTPGTPKGASAVPEPEGETSFWSVQSQTHFSTKVFDVLQTYRGLPVPSSLLTAPPTGATIKISAVDSANPKDDPRFVIWGEIQPDSATVDDASLGSNTDLSNSASSAASGPSRKRSNARPPDAPQVVINAETTAVQTVLIAATIERWIAQLTSEMDYDELLNFLLTYRTYISPVDLCHLLICRFHWALETPTSKQDETVRRIIRVRTFIAIRYWLLTFFREDFLFNPQLCRLFTSWLNLLFKDPALKKCPDALSIVRKLKENVRECKSLHSPLPKPQGTAHPSANGARDHPTSAGVNTKSGDDKPQKLDDSDVDLDFSSVGGSSCSAPLNDSGTMAIPKSFGKEPHSAVFSSPSTHISSAAAPFTKSVLLSQPLSKTILEHVKPTKLGADAPLTQSQPGFASQHSAISRAFVNTIGRLGRWKRVLNARSAVPAPHCGDLSQFDLEPNAAGDLLFVRGGMEEYLKMLNLAPSSTQNIASIPHADPPAETGQLSQPLGLETPVETTEHPDSTPEVESSSEVTEVVLSTLDVFEPTHVEADTRSFTSMTMIETAADNEADSEHEEDPDAPPKWSPEIVSLDDLDLSSSDSESRHSSKVRRLPRRLPLRREFQFVRRSIASVSSMGIRSHSSPDSSVRSGSPMSQRSIVSTMRHSIADDDDEHVGRPVGKEYYAWQVGLISDDEDEAGDAEAALRRLEGQIDLDRQREKEMKVGRWLRTARQTARELERNSIHSVRSDADDEEDEPEERQSIILHDKEDPTVGPPGLTYSQEASPEYTPETKGTTADATAAPPVASAASSTLFSGRDRSRSVGSTHGSILTHSQHSLEVPRPSVIASHVRVTSQFSSPAPPQSHRSFILLHRSEVLAQQFAIIEAELFTKIKFEELISHQWGQSLEDVDVRDWLLFVRERSSLKNTDPSVAGKLSAILALRARFDLLVNFTASEIMLAHSSERVILVEKFIRVAWKMYLHNNFGALVALISGLQTRWVNQAMERRWSKVGIWEQRIFEDLKRFTSRVGQFKYIRNATAALVDAQSLQTLSQDKTSNASAAVSSSSSRPRASEVRDVPSPCVPFLGAYLAQLYNFERLPDFVDPTAPTAPVLIDNETGMLSPPSQPDVFFNLQPLPADITLEPLINVHKQRLIAGVIKSFVGGQHLATNISFKVDHKCYQKCYRLRSLSSEALQNLVTSSRNRKRVV
ncbi:hypothetical protein BU17DRAFT_53758 [Hysterangium stoloniferum]|nr:hypothetical protein BU17DRAFT_53758 [Hysterangium stoloniferum]